MENVLKNDWEPLLARIRERVLSYSIQFLTEEYSTHVVYPKVEDILTLFSIQVMKIQRLSF